MRVLRNLAVAIAAIAACHALVPMKRSRRNEFAHEMGAMKTMAGLQTAESQYFSLYSRFAGSLQELASAGLSPPGIDEGRYRFAVFRTARGYVVQAKPIKFGTTGTQTFFSDETLEIHNHHGPEQATASDPVVK